MNKEVIVGIYCYTNKLNGKKYVGLSNNIFRRHKEHKNHHTKNSYIENAIAKYSISAFELEILEEFDSVAYTRNQLSECEIFWIKKLNCKVPNGYNLTDGGEGVTCSIKKDKYYFYHINYPTEYTTLYNICKKYNLNKGAMSELTNSNCNSVKGWVVNKDYLPKLYSFEHTDGYIELSITRKDMRKKYNLPRSGFNHLMIGTLKTYLGWKIIEENE